uniref:Uncharacterized protein n=1 Tax=Anguilla anguilla TaxID=7936 RepID=A0A0E9SWS3_ANGAN
MHAYILLLGCLRFIRVFN